VLDEGAPIFSQVAERLADDIAEGALAEGDRVPSSNELAAFYRINPATAAKGINVLTDSGLVEKRRGIGIVRGCRGPGASTRRPSPAFCRALRSADAHRSSSARDRHGHVDLDDPRI
jgi:DNA-binding transcriptional MocR family regulator